MDRLPVETQIEILKYNPNFLGISKRYYNDYYAKQCYVNRYCYTPITQNEFKRYLLSHQPGRFFMFYELPNDIYVDFIVEEYGYNDDDTYHLRRFTLTSINSDADEHHFNIDYDELDVDIESIYDTYLDNVFYDVKTTSKILQLRGCNHYLPTYNRDYTIQLFNQSFTDNINVSNMDDFYNIIKRYIIILTNHCLLTGSFFDITEDFYFIFNNLGEPYTPDELQEFVNNIQIDKYNVIDYLI